MRTQFHPLPGGPDTYVCDACKESGSLVYMYEQPTKDDLVIDAHRRFTNAVYDVLVQECGAHDSFDARHAFDTHWPDCGEYRFMGALGFGGKVWFRHATKEIYVSCYPEDKTPERQAMIQGANVRLVAVAIEWPF